MKIKRAGKTASPTERALLALATDLVEFEEIANRVSVQVRALAERHGIQLPSPQSNYRTGG